MGPLQRSIARALYHHEPALKGLLGNCKTKRSSQIQPEYLRFKIRPSRL